VTEFALGPEAIAYVASELSAGRGLARHLATLPLQAGSVVTDLPANVPKSALLNFQSGGVAIGQENANLARLISDDLKAGGPGPRLCVFELGSATRGDPWVANRAPPYFTVEDDVYLFADATSSHDQVHRVVKEAHWYPAIGVVSVIPSRDVAPREGGEADPALLRLLAEAVMYLVIGVYDGEGWLIWRR
jgi:hypothetical protein